MSQFLSLVFHWSFHTLGNQKAELKHLGKFQKLQLDNLLAQKQNSYVKSENTERFSVV